MATSNNNNDAEGGPAAQFAHGESMAKPDATGGHSVTDLARIRKEYGDLNFNESMLPADGHPFTLFREWLEFAVEMKMIEPNAFCLATVSAQGRPANRMVLLKELDDRGFVWFTNYESKKGNDIAANPFAAATFWWGPLEKSVRVEGTVEKIAAEESDAYFQKTKRRRAGRLGIKPVKTYSRPSSSTNTILGNGTEIC